MSSFTHKMNILSLIYTQVPIPFPFDFFSLLVKYDAWTVYKPQGTHLQRSSPEDYE